MSPRSQKKKRSPAQEAQTRWMQGFRHNHRSPGEGDAFQFANPSSDARSKQELVRELDEAKRSNQVCGQRDAGERGQGGSGEDEGNLTVRFSTHALRESHKVRPHGGKWALDSLNEVKYGDGISSAFSMFKGACFGVDKYVCGQICTHKIQLSQSDHDPTSTSVSSARSVNVSAEALIWQINICSAMPPSLSRVPVTTLGEHDITFHGAWVSLQTWLAKGPEQSSPSSSIFAGHHHHKRCKPTYPSILLTPVSETISPSSGMDLLLISQSRS
jgi:hypothetical protein